VLNSAAEGAADLLIALASGAGWGDTSNPSMISRLALIVGLENRPAEVQQILDFVIRGGLNQEQSFAVLYALGEGLHRAGGSLGAADPQSRLQRFYDQSLDLTFNDSLPDRVRVPVLQFRGVTPYADFASGDILQLFFSARQSEPIQSATLGTLAHYANPAIPTNIFQHWPVLSAPVRARALDALLTRGDWIDQIIAALESGRINAADLSSPQMDLLRHWPEQRLAQRAIRVLGPAAIHRPEALAQFAYATRMPGVAQRGRDLFIARCLACHRPSDGRQPVAMDLAHVKTYSRDKVLAAIIEPNAEIRAQWATYFVQNKQGEVWAGVVADDNPTTLSLLVPGREVVIPHDTIYYVQQQSWSLMPAGLETGLTVQNMADLLEYLCPR